MRRALIPSSVARCTRLLLLLAACASTLLLYLRWRSQPARWRYWSPHNQTLWDADSADAPCQMPVLPQDAPELRPFFKDLPPLNCDKEPAWVVTEGGSRLVILEAARQRHGKISCQFTDLLRETDFQTVEGSSTSSETSYTLSASDFVRVSCSASDGASWSSFLAGARQTAAQGLPPLSRLPAMRARLNVLIIGTDSLSRNTFNRKLPMTAAFLRDTLGAVVLTGYNIVGDGTPQALIPILTGQTEPELPEARRRVSGAHHCDVYPFVWNDYQRDGYVTAFLEDAPNVGTFQYRLNGFRRQPTTHYMRTFYLALEPDKWKNKQHCLRDIPRHKVHLDFVESIWNAHSEKAKFVFSFQGELSHDDVNKVGLEDADLLAMLTRLWRSGRLKDTALVMMADHGHRFTDVRNTMQGKLEERLPYFAWVLPKEFQAKYPQEMESLRAHAAQLTTPFDQYFTLQHLRQWPGPPPVDPMRRGRSLFAAGAPRSCADADVLPHWCACVSRQSLSVEHPAVSAAADAFQRYVNALQQEEAPGLCAELRVSSVLSAEELQPQRALRAFVRTKDDDGFEPDLTGDARAQSQNVQLRLSATPGYRLFEVTATRTLPDGVFTVRHQDISRTDRYGSQGRCVEHRMDHMRKLCYCK